VHVAAIEGATVEEIKYGIENGWLPEKTAYTVIHAGRAEIEANASVLSSAAQTRSEEIGKKIGSIYTALIAKTTDGGKPATSVIFSGIIPPDGSTITSSNINYINGNNGIKSVLPADSSYNLFMSSTNTTTVDIFKQDLIDTFDANILNTNVASIHNANQQAIRLANWERKGARHQIWLVS
jgi:hypothetical protein